MIIWLLRKAKQNVTYLLTYAAPVTRKMVHFDEYDYFTMPHLPAEWKPPMWLRIELGIFAGRLYFCYDDYDSLCHYLGVAECADANEEDTVAFNGFADKPLQFLQEWLALRRNGQDFTHTPMGYICQGKKLTSNHPFFSTASTEVVVNELPMGGYGTRVEGASTGESDADESGDDEDESESEESSSGSEESEDVEIVLDGYENLEIGKEECKEEGEVDE